MQKKLLQLSGSVIGTIVVCWFFSGCGGEKKIENKTIAPIATIGTVRDSFPRSQTLYVGGFQWGAPSSFNPLAITPAWPITGNMNLIYEALFGFDLLDGSLKGILGKSFEFHGDVLQVILNENARWHTGAPVTADDVIYSYNLHKKYTTYFSNTWKYITEINKISDYEVQFVLSKDNRNPLALRDIIASLQILPQKIMGALEKDAFDKVAAEAGTAPSNADVLNKIREFKNDIKPVGSGPYTLKTYTDDKIVLQRVDGYWGNILYGGKDAAPRYIIHQAFGSNDSFNLALREGKLDLSQTFFPKIWEGFSNGVGTWYASEPYYIPGIVPALLMSVTKKPFNDVNFRRAVAHAIDYTKIRIEAMYGYTPELKPGLIVPFGSEKELYSDKDAVAFGKLYDPKKARAILKAAGYTWNANGMLNLTNAKGEPLTLFATCPAGWTDWEATIKIAVEGMRAIGIDVKEQFLEYQVWDNNLKNGLFDFTMKTPHPLQAPSLPWSRFDQVMSSHDLLPVGEVMFYNEGRYKNPQADSLLKEILEIIDPEKFKKTYQTINQLFMREMPVIPLMYRPWLFYQFSTKYWTNYPTEQNPYAPPQCLMVGAGVRGLWGITSNTSN
jgi:peptide/nickel transport system substrate-binding protein